MAQGAVGRSRRQTVQQWGCGPAKTGYLISAKASSRRDVSVRKVLPALESRVGADCRWGVVAAVHGEIDGPGHRAAAELVDELVVQQKALARAQTRRAELMMEFSDLRARCDRLVIAEAQASGCDARYKAGEFGAMEIGLAMRESKYSVQKVLGMARRLRAEAPDSWDAWLVGDINHDKVIRINRALRLLVRDESKQLLNHVVVDVAVCKTPELLGQVVEPVHRPGRTRSDGRTDAPVTD